ncbi:hypothetical protein GM418_28470 [Maribellus comscasis]|uniref:Nucleotidyltransferase family protein n=1 Tax=Maribellus comscasis TaxID=2681766 RepID=A0A6I6K4Y3_9BACT|nr:nucleotidyltransferase family protein [Maribellus comscasis]QGY47462.1 hypothetical protein GM418_28470 [Maribellus comscasis]
MNHKELFYFAGRCLSLNENPESRRYIINKCTDEHFDWQAFIHLCSDQLILPALWVKFRNHKIIEYIPEEVKDHLFEIYKLNRLRNKNIIHQIKEITRVLNENGIQPLFLKGAANLLDNIYTDIGERMLADIDFLIHEKEFLAAARILEEAGYSIVEETTDYSEYEEITGLKHYPKLLHPDFDAVIEIHRIPVEEKYSDWFNSGMIFKRKKKPESTAGYFVPSDDHKIIHNFIHSQLSDEGYLYGNLSLRENYDLLLLSKKCPVATALSEIKKKKTATAYFTMAFLILGINQSFSSKRDIAFCLLWCKHTLNLKSATFYHILRSAIFIGQRIFKGYLGRPVRAIYSKSERKAFTNRLRSPQWLRNHLSLYTHFFKIGKKNSKLN